MSIAIAPCIGTTLDLILLDFLPRFDSGSQSLRYSTTLLVVDPRLRQSIAFGKVVDSILVVGLIPGVTGRSPDNLF